MTGTTPRIVISGASGALGRHITEQLLGKHPTSHLTLPPRNPSTVHPTALRQGVKTAPADIEYQPLTAEQRLAMFDEAGVPRTDKEACRLTLYSTPGRTMK